MRLGIPLACLLLLVPSCFNPEQPEDTDGTTASSSSADEMTDTAPSPTTTTTPDPDSTSLDTTEGPADQPPTVQLLVDGSGSPGDVVHARRLALSAPASDDSTVVRVDFFDGAELLASDQSEPFEAELLVTSIDNGAHTLRAVAVDDAAQEGESGPVGLAVDIEGGTTVAAETNLFQMGGISFHPGIGVVHDTDDNVIVVGSLSTTNFDVTGLGVTSLSPDLADTNWQLSVPMSLVDGQPQFLTLGQPSLSGNGSEVLIGGNAMGTDGAIDNNASVFRVAADGSGPLPFLEIPSSPITQHIALAGIDVDPDGNVFLAGPDDNISKIAPMGGATLWESPVGHTWDTINFGGHRIRSNVEGDVIFDIYTCDDMTGTCMLETRKINGFDGNELWTESIDLGDTEWFMHVGGSAPGPDGQILTLHGPPLADGGGLHLVLRDGDGNPLHDVILGGDGDLWSVADLAYDEQGQVVAVGTRSPGGDTDAREPFAMRFDEAGTVHWQRTFSFGTNDDQAMALALDRQGRLVVVGIADIDNIFIVFLGDVWVAQLDL